MSRVVRLIAVAALLIAATLSFTSVPVVDAEYVCAPGFDCVYDQVRLRFPATPLDCNNFPGFVCDGTNITLCEAGSYCPNGLPSSATKCPEGSWCPQGFSYPLKCEATATCPEGGKTHQLFLPIILVVIVCVIATVTFQLFDRRIVKSCCGFCGPAEHALPIKPPTPAKTLGPNGRVINVAGVRVGGGKEPSLTSADVSFMMSGGMRTSIVFRDVSIEVGAGASRRTVLHHLTGKFQSGRLSAIMGPSGSGKSTAMNALTGRIKLAKGSVTLNGVTPLSKLDKIIGFVGQEDIMLPMLTVRQVLIDSALSRLPAVWPLRKKLAIVDDVLEVLQLTKVADSVIGDFSERGISGGEKKRVSVGMELVADPAILFLDEPTSGLDSSSAKELMAALQRVAQRGLIVVAVIHQPRAEIYSMIDDLLLLKTGGQTVYFGEAAAAETYMTWLGFPLPPNCNPADHQLDVVSGRVPLRLLPPSGPLALPPSTPSTQLQQSATAGVSTTDEKQQQLAAALAATTPLAAIAALPALTVAPVGAAAAAAASTATPASGTTSASGASLTSTTTAAFQSALPGPEHTIVVTPAGASAPVAAMPVVGHRRSTVVAPKIDAPIAIPGRNVPSYLTESWLNYRSTFATGKADSLANDYEIRCSQKQIDGVIATSAPPQLLAAVAAMQPPPITPSGSSTQFRVNNLVDSAQSASLVLSLATLALPAQQHQSGSLVPPSPLAVAGINKPATTAAPRSTTPEPGAPAAAPADSKFDGRPLSADGAAAAEKAAMIKAETALIEDVVAVRQPPGFVSQTYLYLKRRVMVDIRAPFPMVLDGGLQLLSGFALALNNIGRSYYLPPLPLAVAETCPDLLRDRCVERAIFGQSPTFAGFFITMVICVASSSFAVRTFGQFNQVWNRERLCGRDLYAYFTANMIYDLLHVTRSAIFFVTIFFPFSSFRGSFGYWFLLFWLLSFGTYGLGYFVSVAVRYQLAVTVVIVAGVAFSVTSGLTPTLSVEGDWWPLPLFWSLSYNRWGAEAIVNLAIKSQIGDQDPDGRVSRGITALGYNPNNLALDLGMLFLIGVGWRLAALARLRFRKQSV